ncbi:MAG TPA: TIGR01906 family membrane protein [Anaerolineales bacterium]|nr:TIGR01906 family membrane protein [Anaerolineales bacterium]HRQ93134.1 TIGR01906 family membrane protein [Anaerolineales bacterium]
MKQLIRTLVPILVPLAIVLTATRLLLTPLFVNIEYHMPGFPEDSYGMTQAERLQYAPLALDYLMNDEDISFLGDQTFEDGTPLYNERELSHMYDVKVLTQQALKVWVGVLLALAALGLLAWRQGLLAEFRAALGQGGAFTVALILALLVLIALSFDWLFTEFHGVFFEGDTWLFLFSDTLIRLFPMRFWQDVFFALGGLSLLAGLGLWRGMRRVQPARKAAKRK